MNVKVSNVFSGIFYFALFFLSFFALINYPGNAVVYIVFTIALNALLILGFTKDKIFFDTFIGIFFWLGYWLKLSVRVAFMGGEFQEPVGNFNGTGAAFDHALIVTTCGVAALLIAGLVRRRYFFSYADAAVRARHESTFAFYKRYRKPVLVLFFALFAAVGITNVIFGIYQRGSIPRTFLPFGLNGVYTWLLLFGMASVSAVILDCEFRIKNNPYLVSVMSLLECFVSNVSMLSRGMVLNGGSLMIGLADNAKKRFVRLSLSYKLVIPVIFAVLFIASVFVVNHVRVALFFTYPYGNASVDVHPEKATVSPGEAAGSDRTAADARVPNTSPHANSVPRRDLNSVKLTKKSFIYTVNTIWVLLIDRWVGIEGAMAVSSYPHLGWDLWKRAWKEKFSNYGTSMFDLTFIRSPYLESDMLKHHFVSVPGILAFFYYPGSFSFLFISMFLLGLLAAGIEFIIYKLSGANLILCSLLSQVVAYRYAHFGYVPAQSYLLFGSLLLNVLIIYFFDKSLCYRNRKNN